MRKTFIFICCAMTAGCAGPIAAWKGRAYGEHSINPGKLVAMSGTFRTGRSGWIDGKTVFCLEPWPEIAVLMAGSSKTTLPLPGKVTGSLEDTANVNPTKGHESSSTVQTASLAYSISCVEWINGALTKEEHTKNVQAIIDHLTSTIGPEPDVKPGAQGKPRGQPTALPSAAAT